ncbi:hypothetical protein N791_08480 [Lysobacter defluvii IMMIB APB-9 = DSM 18482]|uniref:Uncharacterized protein n=1 Tax=Lysobacter defluvii IMMIB APB-9 = DSM 18482 TaxID=1385515 RepID=A0A0A0M6V8_9GAMM|nr:hypothetical protein N791_08480 [Lysobacter defluvii IMMIB APB-9 = DSM 18482]
MPLAMRDWPKPRLTRRSSPRSKPLPTPWMPSRRANPRCPAPLNRWSLCRPPGKRARRPMPGPPASLILGDTLSGRSRSVPGSGASIVPGWYSRG